MVEGCSRISKDSNVPNRIYFLVFLLGKIGYVPAELLSLVQESSTLDPKPANVIQEGANMLFRKTTCSESVFVFKLLKVTAVELMLHWGATHILRSIQGS